MTAMKVDRMYCMRSIFMYTKYMGNVRIIEQQDGNITVESNLQDIYAARNRLRMLQKHNPGVEYWIAPVETLDRGFENPLSTPKVTVTPIPKFTVTRIH